MSMNVTPPRSRMRCTHPSTMASAPTSLAHSAPQVCVRVRSPSGSDMRKGSAFRVQGSGSVLGASTVPGFPALGAGFQVQKPRDERRRLITRDGLLLPRVQIADADLTPGPFILPEDRHGPRATGGRVLQRFVELATALGKHIHAKLRRA